MNCEKQTLTELCRNTGRSRDYIKTFCEKLNITPKYEAVTLVEEPIISTRPPSIYTNSRSPFGIADELHNKKIA